MTEESQTRDPELDGLLAAAGDGGAELSKSELEAMFESVEERVSATRGNPLHWLRSRSTLLRRVLALGSFFVIFAVIGGVMPAGDWAKLATAEIVLALISLFVLLVASLMVAMRPLHQPELPKSRLLGLAIGSVLATFVLAVTVHGPSGDAHAHAGSLISGATPCMYFGLLVGIPVYGMARLLDRGTYLGPLLAAAAAGLTGNFMLQMRCPISDPLHNVVGHASVALIFVGGILLLESLFRRR
jgi:hypothetical protein